MSDDNLRDMMGQLIGVGDIVITDVGSYGTHICKVVDIRKSSLSNRVELEALAPARLLNSVRLAYENGFFAIAANCIKVDDNLLNTAMMLKLAN